MTAQSTAPLSTAEIEALAERHPQVFASSFWRHARPVIFGVLAVVYGVYCWWFFGIGKVLGEANWDIAGNYLADWVSYETRPDFEIETDGAMSVSWPRFSPLGDNPKPDWIATTTRLMERRVETPAVTGTDAPASAREKTAASGFMVPGAPGTEPKDAASGGSSFSFMAPGAPTGGASAQTTGDAAPVAPTTVREEVIASARVTMGAGNVIDITPRRVVVSRGEERVVLLIDRIGETVRVEGGRGERALPDWASQKLDGGKVIVRFGFVGRAEIHYDAVKVRHRFLGWENFVFDTNSPFWDKSAGEVVSLVLSGPRIDPSRSNLSLAWNNILYNAEWQHLDVWTKLLQTIVMAFVGTLFAGLVAFPLAFLAARNITRSHFFNQLCKRFFDFQRSVDMLIWALFFTRAFGPGPLAGISAIFFTDTGTLGKLYSESLENIDDKQREGVKSVGASPMAVQRYGVLPQVLPLFASQALYFWESNTRSATIIGAVGAGGIGLKLWEAMRTNQDWENVAYMVLLILAVVFIFDNISNALRARLMGKPRH